ncbi:MAG: SDR family NAD(P)-dependent oxidoreductase [Proteobacteria bacterium]|nr:SDR family NAD(P)-dependent oxidoreductase [Pseudomonadota bacterium]
MRKLRDRIAVVTGASSGIGRALATELAAQGCHLALVDVDGAGLQGVAAQVRELGREASEHVVDVADRSAMSALPEAVASRHGGVHLLVNNAGVSVSARFEDHDLDDFEWLVGINFWGVVYGCKFFLPHLLAADEGHIVNLSSIFGIVGIPSQSSYCATKFAVRGFSESLWTELRDTPVGVTSVHPGGIRTNIVRSSRMSAGAERAEMEAAFERFGGAPEQAARKIIRAVRRNRLRLRIRPESVVGDWLKRLAPSATQHLVALGARRSSLVQ